MSLSRWRYIYHTQSRARGCGTSAWNIRCSEIGRWKLYLPHNTNRCLSSSLGHTVLHQVKHVLVIQQANQVEGTEAGSAAQGQVPDYHRAAETWQSITWKPCKPSRFFPCGCGRVFFLQTCRRTTWAGTAEPPGGSWAGVRKAWAPGWPRSAARPPTAPGSSAAVAWPWSPAPSAEPPPPHTGTPMMPAPIRQPAERTASESKGKLWT